MLKYADKIRQEARDLLQSGEVDVFVGFRKGTIPMMNEPILIRDARDAEKLHWDSNCGINLANYLTKRKERMGVVAVGCHSRNIVTHIVENQISRDQVVVVGVPCEGMLDRRRIHELAGRREILEVLEEKSGIVIRGHDFEQRHNKQDVLQENCAICIHRNPVIWDRLVGETVKEQDGVDRYEDIRAVEAMAPDARWSFFQQLIEPCIRCYACRNACPLCYCPTCFVDESRPQWVGKSIDAVDTLTFHFLRAYHCAGRCTDCGACERACPVGIKVRQFTKKLEKDILELYGWEAGLSLDERPPLDRYRPDDPEEFIK